MSLTLTIGNAVYRHWTAAKVTRGLKRASSSFVLTGVGDIEPPILPFQPCTIADDGDLLLTGYVSSVAPDIGPTQTRSVVTGKSATQDLVDCMADLATNQFNGYALDAIARAMSAPFGIGIVVAPGVSVGDPFADATYERSETAFAFLERLARQRGILLTDDENGNLVLATAGTARAPGNLVMGPGGNVSRAEGVLDGSRRYSSYTVVSQAGMKATGSDVQCGVVGVASDGAVPRYRPWCGTAETAAMPGDAALRAAWEAAHRAGEGCKAILTVPGWRAGNVLWQPNRIATCTVPKLALADDFLIGQVDWTHDHQGHRAALHVAPPSAFTPAPAIAKGAGNAQWAGVVPVP